MVYKGVDHRKPPLICFFTITWKTCARNWLYFAVEKARALHLTSFLLSVLLQTIATSKLARENFNNFFKYLMMWLLQGRLPFPHWDDKPHQMLLQHKVYYSWLTPTDGSILLIERFRITFTANGKRQK